MKNYKTFAAYMERGSGYGQYSLVLENLRFGSVIEKQKCHSTDSCLWDKFTEVEAGSIEHRRLMRVIKRRVESSLIVR